MTALLRLTATETRLFFREPIGVVFTLALPPVLLVVLGSIPAFREPGDGPGALRVIDVYTPIVIAVAIATFALTSLPQLFATYREKGILRRMRTTPVRPAAMLGAQLLMAVLLAAATTLLVLAIARLAFDVPLPRRPLGLLVAFILTASAMFALGLLVAALAPGGASASAIGLVLFFPMLFFAGLWIPRGAMNGALRTVSDLTPLGSGVQSLHDAAAGDWPGPLHLAVLLGWTVVAGALAARYFRWE